MKIKRKRTYLNLYLESVIRRGKQQSIPPHPRHDRSFFSLAIITLAGFGWFAAAEVIIASPLAPEGFGSENEKAMMRNANGNGYTIHHHSCEPINKAAMWFEALLFCVFAAELQMEGRGGRKAEINNETRTVLALFLLFLLSDCIKVDEI